jgi:hypothetical protein
VYIVCLVFGNVSVLAIYNSLMYFVYTRKINLEKYRISPVSIAYIKGNIMAVGIRYCKMENIAKKINCNPSNQYNLLWSRSSMRMGFGIIKKSHCRRLFASIPYYCLADVRVPFDIRSDQYIYPYIIAYSFLV